MAYGRLHPISAAVREIADIFGRMGFSVASGPELEDEWHNFDALNIPTDHPARDMQDTLWVDKEEGRVMRTHTSPVQIRYMEEQLAAGMQPPYRVIVPGKVFRRVEIAVPQQGTVEMCIRAPASGIYALSLLHDRDGNHRFGLSIDGIGFGGNPKLGWSKPKAATASVRVGPTPTRTRIVLNYRRGLLSFGPIED